MKNNFTIAMLSGLCVGAVSLHAQSIRYPVSEMSTADRQFFASAYASCNATSSTPHTQLYLMHDAGFGQIHHQSQWARDQFMPWHRIASKLIEEHVQTCGISGIPYWDETNPANQTKSSTMFNADFLGNPSLTQWLTPGRERVMSGTLPVTNALVDAALNEVNYQTMSHSRVEMTDLHNGAHVWIGGDMVTRQSPRDPAFWMHHIFVDKVFDDWMIQNGFPSGTTYQQSIYGFSPYNSASRGAVTILPNSILRSERDLGVFYARNGVAKLGGGYVVGTGRKFTPTSAPDCFIYPGRIEVANMTVPAGGNATFNSRREIVFNPGFVSNGEMRAVSDPTGNPRCGGTLLAKIAAHDGIVDAPSMDDMTEFFDGSGSPLAKVLSIPTDPMVRMEFQVRDMKDFVHYKIVDMHGKVLKSNKNFALRNTGMNLIEFDRRGIPPGIHYFILTIGDKRQISKLALL